MHRVAGHGPGQARQLGPLPGAGRPLLGRQELPQFGFPGGQQGDAGGLEGRRQVLVGEHLFGVRMQGQQRGAQA